MCNIVKNYTSAGILTSCPSAAPFGFSLGPTNPWLNTIAKETLDFQCVWLSHTLRLLRPTFSLLYTPQSVTLLLRCVKNASLPCLPDKSGKYPCLRYYTLAPGIFGANHPSSF